MKRSAKLPYSPWIGIVAAVLYAVTAGLLANQIARLDVNRSQLEDFALGHFITTPVLLLIGFLFVKYASWETEVWTTKPPGRAGYQKRWLWLFPILSLAQSIIALSVSSWKDLNLPFILTILGGTILLAIGEEMYFRGILRASLNNFKNELPVVLLLALLFGLAHSLGSLFNGVPILTVLLVVSVTAFQGIGLYAILKATGTLWAPIFFHFLTDFSLYIGSGPEGSSQGSATFDLPLASGYVEMLMGLATFIFLVAVWRNDRKSRRNVK